MAISCIKSDPITLQECTSECVRWTTINTGSPLLVYHDPSGWDKDYYPNAGETNPLIYLQTAMDLWNEAYTCGTLFQLTSNESEAVVRVRYQTRADDDCGAIGTALCACDDPDDPCNRQFDHSQIFSADGQKDEVTMFHVDCVRVISAAQWTNVYVHELGHVLGMGHVYNLPVVSIMGSSENSNNNLVIYPYDQEQLDRRYMCGCIRTTGIMQDESVPPYTLHQTSDHCQGCNADQMIGVGRINGTN